jgi:nicotinate phosphoribosyltransferase
MSLENSALLTDQYQLTMLQGYFDQQMFETAVFELFIRKLPTQRNFLVAAGLDQVIEFLEAFLITEEELAWLQKERSFRPEFIDFLRKLRFTGDVDAMPEGTVFFGNEPILRITAPLPIAQLIETRLINLLQFQTMIASKAARCVLAAPGKGLIEFGLRRAHGAEAGLLASRAACLAGFAATSNVLAGKCFNIPVSGTMAHAFVQSHEREEDAFVHFARSNPGNVVFLIDTYDTIAAAHKVVKLAPQLTAEGVHIRGVRLDSGDLADLARKVRTILDAGGLQYVKILASGDLEEIGLQKLLAEKAPIDGFGVGTRLVTAWDHPYLSAVYKLQEYAGCPRCKYSEAKVTWPGRKQVFRHFKDGRMVKDVLALTSEQCEGKPLLVSTMRGGKRVTATKPLEQIRQNTLQELDSLPEALKRIDVTATYDVEVSGELQDLAAALKRTAFSA